MNQETLNAKEYEAIKHFLDPDIREAMETRVKDHDGKEYGVTYFMTNSALVATNIQLMRIFKEAIGRGFIVKE